MAVAGTRMRTVARVAVARMVVKAPEAPMEARVEPEVLAVPVVPVLLVAVVETVAWAARPAGRIRIRATALRLDRPSADLSAVVHVSVLSEGTHRRMIPIRVGFPPFFRVLMEVSHVR